MLGQTSWPSFGLRHEFDMDAFGTDSCHIFLHPPLLEIVNEQTVKGRHTRHRLLEASILLLEKAGHIARDVRWQSRS